ncbi:MAG TPA: cyanophycinase [Verrucomicrobiales bacterium]|nr:cyanophycinase [Verrucomicrobiales bacterium]
MPSLSSASRISRIAFWTLTAFCFHFAPAETRSSPSGQRDGPSPPRADSRPGPLFLHGGGELDAAARAFFLELAGGVRARIVVIPTSEAGDIDPAAWRPPDWLRDSGCASLTVLHTRERSVADSPDFAAPLRQCSAVWFTGGRQWRSTDVYLGTRAHRALLEAHQSGVLVGGSSAGATLLGSFLLRGAPQGNHILIAKDRQEALGLLPSTAIDQHVFTRGRERDLVGIIRQYPELLGIGIDENTTVVARDGTLSIFGEGRAALYDANRWRPQPPEPPWLELGPGHSFDLESRTLSSREED